MFGFYDDIFHWNVYLKNSILLVIVISNGSLPGMIQIINFKLFGKR